MDEAKKRDKNPGVLLVASGLALAAAVTILLAGRSKPPPLPAFQADAGELPAPDAGRSRITELEISDISGGVEVRRGAGAFEPAKLGTLVKADDAVRTAKGRARLSVKGAYEVQIEPGTLLEVDELTARLSRFELGAGMLVAKVEGSAGQQLEVKAANSDALATARDGTFAISNNGAGTVAVGARAGEVDFRAAGRAVLLRAGQQSIAQGGAPSAPAPIPSSLFLKVDWPEGNEVNKRRLALAGRTTPGSVVMIAGERARVERDGRFQASIRLREGHQVIQVQSLGVGGDQSTRQAELTVDTTAPDSDIPTQKLWEERQVP
jgi:hypothetical protein